MQPIDHLGPSPLFLGVETISWSLSQFESVAVSRKAQEFSSLLVKIADGGNVWYGAVGGWNRVIETINNASIKAVPYVYCYGNHFGALQTECTFLANVMHACGVVIADMEIEYNGHPEYAIELTQMLHGVPGNFGVTTWANPEQQDWTSVLQALAPATNFWLPQVYTDYLASVYHAQYDPHGLPYYPVLYLGDDLGPNDVTTHARNSNSEIIAFWEHAGVERYLPIITPILHKGAHMPQGWKDVGEKLIAPNGHYIVKGFRDFVKSADAWDAGNVPLMEEQTVAQVELHSSAGAGSRCCFRDGMLVWTQANGVKESVAGEEIFACYSKIDALETEIANLKVAPGNVNDAIAVLQAAIASFDQILSVLGQVTSGVNTVKDATGHALAKLQGK